MAAVVLAVVVMVAVAPSSGAATNDDPSLEATVQIGFDGYVAPGRPAPVQVTLTASELRSGELEVQVENGAAELSDFEIAGGSSEVHWVLLDTMESGPTTVTASARIGGREVDLGNARSTSDESQLVGTLAGLSNLADGEPVSVIGDQRLRIVQIDPAMLDLGPGALAALDAVAVTPEDIASLSERHRDAILGWLSAGGTLYVDAPPGELAGGWPAALQPTSAVVRDGLSTVIATSGALSEGRWSAVILPAPSRSIQEDGVVAQGISFTDASSEVFGVDLGRDLPPLSELLGILLAYTVLVGPIVYILFRRKVMLRWVAIPVLALLAAGVLFVRGGSGTETTASVVDIVETGPGPAMVSTQIVMSTDVDGRKVVAPAGWSASAADLMSFMPGAQVTQRRGAEVELSVPAQAGGVGVLRAHGPAPFEGALEVTATATGDDGTVTGTVRNTTAATLEEVAVFFARTTTTQVGDLAPGASAEFTLSGTNQSGFPGMDVFQQTWPNDGFSQFGGDVMMAPMPTVVGRGGVQGQIIMGGGGMRCDDTGRCFPVAMSGACSGPGCLTGVARPGSLGSALRPLGANGMSYGMVTAVGWTSELAPVVDLGSGVDVVDRHTAVVGRAVPAVGGDRLGDSASVRRVVSASPNVSDPLEITFSEDLPTSVGGRPVDLGRLRMYLPLDFHRVEILTPSGPLLVRDIDPNNWGDAPTELVVPPEAVVGGRVLYTVALRPMQPPSGRDMVIYEAAT